MENNKNLANTTPDAVMIGPLELLAVLATFFDIYIPKASDSVSEIAIVSIPTIIANLELVPALRPIIKPMVVIVPDIIPKYDP